MENTIKSKVISKWLEDNPDKWRDAVYDGGYNTKTGMAYDILLNRGWCDMGEYGYHTIIERTVTAMIGALRGIKPCRCKDCETGDGW